MKNLQSAGITDEANDELYQAVAMSWAMGLY